MDKRIDPCFYQPKYHNFYNMLKASKYQVVMLADLIKLIYRYPSCYGFSCYDTASDTRVPFLQGEDIGITEISHEKLIFIEKGISEKYPKTILKEGDLIFSVRGTIGKVVMVTKAFENSNISPNLIRLSINAGINSHYVEIVLKSKIGQSQIDRLISGGVQPTITKQDILSIEIPLPPLEIQNHIVEIMQSAYAQKKQKEQEADTLLDSIDDYVLSELGVELQKPNNNRVENRIFTATFSDVSGRRLDPEAYYQVYSLYTESYPMERLQDCVLINPQTSFYGYELDTSITSVPMKKVSARYGEADLSLCKVIREAQGYTKFREDDLIWAKITPCMENGKSAVVDNLKGGVGCGSTEFHVFRALDGINIRYIHALLRLKSLREHAVLHFTGSAGQQRVPSAFFKELIIPKPPIEKQTEIANHIGEIRNHAKQLQQEADAIVERAKREVERILLEGVSD